MATLNIYKLHFTSPLHIGDRRDDYGISQKTISSDTLYAALTASLAKVDCKSIPEDGDLGFAISSTFPYYQETENDDPVYFFPKPLFQKMPELSNEELSLAKSIKKVSWVDKEYFERTLAGENLFMANSNSKNDVNGAYLSSRKVDKGFVYSQVVQRVSVSRNGNDDAKPFYMDKIYFKGYSGLFFIAEGDTTKLDKALKILSLEGIGTDRNVGNGLFEWETSTIDLKIPERTDHVVCMSLFFPESKEQFTNMIDSKFCAYDFERRGGWITTFPHNTIRKNVIYGLTASSVFKRENTDGICIMGRIVDLKPKLDASIDVGHPVWRSGKSLFIPINL